MTKTQALETIVEMWPSLSEKMAESLASQAAAASEFADFKFTPEQLALIDQSRDDFANGRTMSFKEAMDGIKEELNLKY